MYKETVMSDGQLRQFAIGYIDFEEVDGEIDWAKSKHQAGTVTNEMREVAEAQAKITWEARDKEVDRLQKLLDEEVPKLKNQVIALNKKLDDREADLKEAEKAGIKKVVDWIKFNCLPQPQPFESKGEQTGYYVDFKDLEDVLKEVEKC